MSLEHLVMLESKEVVKETKGWWHVKGTQSLSEKALNDQSLNNLSNKIMCFWIKPKL